MRADGIIENLRLFTDLAISVLASAGEFMAYPVN